MQASRRHRGLQAAMAAMAEEVNMKRRKLCDADLLRSHNEDDENGLHVQFINSYIGDGVFTKKQFYKGQLLLEYRGKLMLAESLDVSDSTYVYFFNHSNKTYCIDATHNLCVGRKVNDVDKASKANCKMRKIEVDGIPRLGLFALNDIKMNEELRYDYGDRKAPWRKLKKNDDKPILYKQTSNVKSYTECSKVFVCSGKQSIQEQIIKLVTAFGGRFEKEFSERTTHVIMETGIEGKRICNRTKKYFLGIAHHCWILNSKYVEMSLESGHYLSEEEYEIEGDQAFQKGFGAKLSRKDPKLLLEGVAFNFVGEGKDFPREAAEDIVLALGGMLGGEKSLTVSLDESGEPHTVDRTWLFDTLSLFTHLEPDSYLFENLSYTEEEMDCENADNDIKPEICSMESSYSNTDLYKTKQSSEMKDIGTDNLDLADNENCSVMKDIGSEENNNEENGNLDLADDENCSGMKDIGSEENNNEGNGNLDLADDENCSVMNDVGSEENNNEENDNLDLADDENCSVVNDFGSEENNNEGNDNLDLADDENCSVMNDVGSEENNNEGNDNLDLADDENCSVMNDVGSEENNHEGNDNLDLADDENCSVMNDVGSEENNSEENDNLDLADDENCSVMNDVGSEETYNEGNDNLDLADDENCSVMKDIGSEENNNEGNDNLDLADDENCSVMNDVGSEENNNEGNDNLDLADDENCSVMKDIGSEENNNEENGNLDLADDENCSVMNYDFDLADDEIGLIIYCDSDGDYIPERDDPNSDSDDDDDDDNYPEMRDLDSSDKNYAELKNLHSNVNIVPDSNTEDESDDNMSGIIPIGDGPISFRTENPKQTTCQDDRKNSSSVTKNFLVPQSGGSSCDEKFAENSQARDMKKMYVSMSKRSKEGKRLWDKKHACLYCGKLYPKLARHLTDVHSNELDVSRALAFKKKSKERKAVWREIMNNGDCQHNAQVLQHQEGEIIPFKRPTELRDGTDYIQCDKCSGTFLRKDIWRHVKNVHPRQEGDQKGKKRHQVASAALVPVSEVARKEFQNIILNKMSNDKISLISRNDADIVLFGQRMFQKHGNKRHQHQYIRTKMRELARFVEHVRTIDTTVLTLGDCIDGLKFSTCVEATKSLCGYSKDKLSFEKPSLARKLGHSLHKVARQVKTKAMKIGNQEMKEKALNFIEIYKEDWDNEVSHMAGETLETQKYNKPRRLPLAEDLKALSVHLKGEAEILCEAFSKKHASETEWRKLCEVTLAQVVLFNKRRSGEAERLEVKQYIDGTQQGKTIQEEILLSLSPLERKLAEVIDRVEIRGKRGRRVAILLPENIKKQLDILLKYRSVGSIQNDNIYMFARPGDAEFPVRATDVLRRFGNSCGAKRPELLTSTLFRKHIAVIAQMLNLKENELDVLAGFLGHDIGVHREFYRLPEDTTQVAKVSKLLLELERGNIHKFQGKSLDEIQFDLEEPVEGDEESEGEESADDKLTTECNDAARDTPRDTMTNKHKTAVNRKMWTSNEQSAVKRQLEKFFFCEKLPGKHQIEEARKKEPLLMNRSWVQIKSYIKNKKITLKRKHPSSSYN